MTTTNDNDMAQPARPTKAECEAAIARARARLSGRQLLDERQRLAAMLQAHAAALPDEVVLGLMLQLAEVTLQVAAFGVPDAAALAMKRTALASALRVTSAQSNLRAMVLAALACDEFRLTQGASSTP